MAQTKLNSCKQQDDKLPLLWVVSCDLLPAKMIIRVLGKRAQVFTEGSEIYLCIIIIIIYSYSLSPGGTQICSQGTLVSSFRRFILKVHLKEGGGIFTLSQSLKDGPSQPLIGLGDGFWSQISPRPPSDTLQTTVTAHSSDSSRNSPRNVSSVLGCAQDGTAKMSQRGLLPSDRV